MMEALVKSYIFRISTIYSLNAKEVSGGQPAVPV